MEGTDPRTPAEQGHTTKDIAAEQARKPLDERVGADTFTHDASKRLTEWEKEAERWEQIANVQLEAAQTFERAVGEFGEQVANLEGALRKNREYSGR
jgi:hypothetical protein